MPRRSTALAPSTGALILVALFAAPAGAEIYKWVDEKGVVNYSESPPPKGRARVITPEGPPVSVYTPPAPREPAAAERELKNRVSDLEQTLARERQAQDYAAGLEAEREAQWLERCRQDRRVDCGDDPWGVDYPYVIHTRPPHWHPRPMPRPKSLPHRALREPEYLKSVEPRRAR